MAKKFPNETKKIVDRVLAENDLNASVKPGDDLYAALEQAVQAGLDKGVHIGKHQSAQRLPR